MTTERMEAEESHVAKSGSLDFVARDKRLDFRPSNSGNGRLFSATIGRVQGEAHGSGGAGNERKRRKAGGCVDERVQRYRGYSGYGRVWEETSLYRERHFPLIMDRVRLRPMKLITYFHGSRALRQPDQNALQEHYLKAIKMHAKRTLFNYGKIFVITRPLPSTIPIPTLFSQPSCLTLQPRGPLTIRNYSMSSERVLNWRATRTQVGPLSHLLSSNDR
jgi:hypothetical protein